MFKLTHPEHGTHFAYTDLELKQCLKNGWKEVKPEKQRGRPKRDKSRTDQQIVI